jgi:hypothetical protein
MHVDCSAHRIGLKTDEPIVYMNPCSAVGRFV